MEGTFATAKTLLEIRVEAAEERIRPIMRSRCLHPRRGDAGARAPAAGASARKSIGITCSRDCWRDGRRCCSLRTFLVVVAVRNARGDRKVQGPGREDVPQAGLERLAGRERNSNNCNWQAAPMRNLPPECTVVREDPRQKKPVLEDSRCQFPRDAVSFNRRRGDLLRAGAGMAGILATPRRLLRKPRQKKLVFRALNACRNRAARRPSTGWRE